MRVLASAASLLMAAALAGCGERGDTADWDSPPDPTALEALVADFNQYAASVDESWERSPAMAAGEFLRLDQRTAARTTIDATASPEGGGPQTVVVTLDGIGDDSVRAERWTLRFEPEDEQYRLVEATWAQRCQPDRGHQDFSTEECV